MATWHSCALARQPRSLPFLVLYTRNGIFNRAYLAARNSSAAW
jgi:hypothetical protein